jgi:hypothetical protein
MSLMPFTLDLRLWRWQVPGGDKLPHQLVGDAMPRSRGVDAAFNRRHGYPDATRVRCPCRLLGPGRHRYRYQSEYALTARRPFSRLGGSSEAAARRR